MKIIDLSVELADGMIRYPSPYLPEVQVKPAATHEEHARSAQILTFGTHVSTHLDAPFHAIPDGKTIDQIPLEHLAGPTRILRFPDRDRLTPLEAADFESVPGLSECKKLAIDTGWASKTWGTAEYFSEGAYLTRDAARFLASLPKLHLLAMDFPNIDAIEDMKMGVAAPNHQILLGREIILLENLVQLEAVDDDFFLMATPMKLIGGDGCPTRAVAVFPLDDAAAWAAGQSKTST